MVFFNVAMTKPMEFLVDLERFLFILQGWDHSLQRAKLALEEYQQWLDGIKDPFLILTYYENMEYL